MRQLFIPFGKLSSAGVTDHGALTGLSDYDHTQYLLASGSRALTGTWVVGSFKITAETFTSDVATGTAPFVVASTTKVTNLNADTVDGFSLDQGGLIASSTTFDIITSADGGTESIKISGGLGKIESLQSSLVLKSSANLGIILS
ncbi:MAG: hypothetical protein IIC74_10150, partial [Bacteroidetes bacterium]|nr:hypothetical protein [Bacteroidota bacterium]